MLCARWDNNEQIKGLKNGVTIEANVPWDQKMDF